MSDVSGFLQGFSQSLNGYLQTNQQNQQTMNNEVFKNKLAEDSKIKEQAANQEAEGKRIRSEKQAELDSKGKVTPEMAGSLFSSISPEFGQAAQKYATDFKAKNGRDLTTDETKTGLLDLVGKMGGDKPSRKDQNAAFEKAKTAITSSRGDPALGDISKQQTAIGLGYRTLADVRAGKMTLTPAIWTDVMGQLWKGRTGGVPPEQVMKHLEQGNVVEAFRDTLNKLSGYELKQDVQPKVVIDNMLDFLDNSGKDVDERFQGLMASHLVKDDALPDDKYKELVDAVNKRTFTGYTEAHRKKLDEIRQKEATGAGHAGTQGTTKRGTSYKVVG